MPDETGNPATQLLFLPNITRIEVIPISADIMGAKQEKERMKMETSVYVYSNKYTMESNSPNFI